MTREPSESKPSRDGPIKGGKHDHTILLLQGGGALGAYQAGAVEGLAEAGIHPDWIVGISIGAVNSTLIAGNPPEKRVAALREFWERASAHSPLVPPSSMEAMRPALSRMTFAATAMFGIQGFFTPRMVPPWVAPAGSPEAMSFYDVQPLKATLQELVDFDLINRQAVRLSLGAVNVRTGNSIYFDNHKMELNPDHTLASGALPPGFPPAEIDGEVYMDGGISSNSPLWYVLDQDPRMSALILQVDVFSAAGEVPKNLEQAQERSKDILFSSKTRFNTNRLREVEELRASLRRLLEKLPKSLQSDPDVERLTEISTRGPMTLVHLINRHPSRNHEFKDGDFARATVTELWEAGRSDARRIISHPEWCNVTDFGEGLHVYDLTR
jgi:NTE family protein